MQKKSEKFQISILNEIEKPDFKPISGHVWPTNLKRAYFFFPIKPFELIYNFYPNVTLCKKYEKFCVLAFHKT